MKLTLKSKYKSGPNKGKAKVKKGYKRLKNGKIVKK